MKNKKNIAKVIVTPMWYILLVIALIITSFFTSILIIKSMNRKAMKTNILRVEAKVANYKEAKMSLVDKCNKLETKMSRASSDTKINKYNKKLDTLKRKIDNLNLIINTPIETNVDKPLPPNKIVDKFETKISEIKENIMI